MNQHAHELGNAAIVQGLYRALAANEPLAAQQYLVPELDFWYYGPPSLHCLKRVLTGLDPCSSFSFQPLHIFVTHNKVFVEGLCSSTPTTTTTTSPSFSWVHIWSVKDGRLFRLREYVNTSVQVIDGGDIGAPCSGSNHHVVVNQNHEHSQCVLWRSSLHKCVESSTLDKHDSSYPSLILYSP